MSDFTGGEGRLVILACTVPVPVPLFFSSSKRVSRTFLLFAIFCLMPFCWLAKLQVHNIMRAQRCAWIVARIRDCVANSPFSNGHPLRVSRGNHEADGRGCHLTSGSVLHVPFGAIVLEQSVPFPTYDLPLCTLTFAICHLLPDHIYSLDTERDHTV